MIPDRILLHLTDGRRVPVDPSEIYLLETAEGGRVREIRPVDDGGWEVRMDPPVNRVLPVSRREASDLFAAYGEAG